MGIFHTILNRAGRYFLSKTETSRHRKGFSFTEATSVLILYTDKGESHYNKIKRYVKYLKEEQGMREVMALGFVNVSEKNLPVYHKHQLEFEFFSKSDLNWYNKPQPQMDKFINKEFDILIDLVFEPSLPMEFVLALSKARMKVGKKGAPGEEHCDLTFNMEGRDNLDEFLHQINHYLTNYSIQ